ncbi:fibrous sheath CABYR-binding protein-like [Narcine bancroftii]|uniref:fibrous sheath CABYR-binding protein-like n=1 Tax=Narcine bancroftii TaxID=1343680 RepID=UPI0038319DE1
MTKAWAPLPVKLVNNLLLDVEEHCAGKMMGSSIPFQSHWPKVSVDSHGHFVKVTPVNVGQFDPNNPKSHKLASCKKTPTHPPYHHFMKEKYFPHGSQAFLTLLAQFKAKAIAQSGLECVGTHIPSPAEWRALEELRQETEPGPSSATASKAADPAQRSQPASQKGQEDTAQETQETATAQASEVPKAVTTQTPDYLVMHDPRYFLRETGGWAICLDTAKSPLPGFQLQCPCEMITLTYCPCKLLKEQELSTVSGQVPPDQQDAEPNELVEQADTAPTGSAEDTNTVPAEPTEQTNEVTIEPAEQIGTAPTEPPEEADTVPSEPAEEADTVPAEPAEVVDTGPPEPAEAVNTTPPEPAEVLETSAGELAEN